jgi:uncharacterized RDD family membrane protein YckC
MIQDKRLLLLGLGIAVPFFALAGFLIIGLAGWTSYNFGLLVSLAILVIVVEWWLIMRAKEVQPSEAITQIRDAQFQEGEVVYATFWRRFGAYIIDGIIVGIIQYVLSSIIATFIFDLQPTDIGEFFTIAGGLYALIFLISIMYYILYWAWRGQTLGKMAMGIKIVRLDGSSIGVGRATLRYVGYLISTMTLLIGFLMIIGDSKKQGLHDKIADTYVVRVE